MEKVRVEKGEGKKKERVQDSVGIAVLRKGKKKKRLRKIDKETEEGVIKFLNTVFEKYGVCNMQFIRQQIPLYQATIPALQKRLSRDDFDSILNEVAECIHTSYLRRKLGDPTLDKYRDIILQVYRQEIFCTLKQAKAELTEKLAGEPIPSEEIILKFLREIAYKKKARWIFKSGNGNL